MGRSYSVDLRERVSAFVDAGHSLRAAARDFNVCEASRSTSCGDASSGSCEPGRQGRPAGGGKVEPYATFIVGLVEEKPDINMPELRDRLMEAHAITADPAALPRFLCKLGCTYKKSHDGHGARSRRRP